MPPSSAPRRSLTRLVRHALALVATALVLAFSSTAAAQVALNGAPIHSGMNHPNNASQLMISQVDCNANTTFTFAVTGLAIQKTLSVWATSQGGDCTQSAQRNPGSTQTCYKVKEAYIPAAPPSDSVVITSAAIVGGIGGGSAGGVTGCTDTTAGDAPRKLVLYFLIDEAAGNVTDKVTYDIDFDLRGPPPPTQLAPSTFDESTLLVKYCTPAGTSDIAGYKIYCDASGASGEVSPSTNPVCSTTNVTTSTSSAASGSGGSTSASTSGTGGSSAEASSSAVTASSSASSSTGGSSTCTSTTLASGTVPTGLVECATVSGITAIEAEAAGFTLGQLGAIAIASYDNVGNVGKLSELVCGQTEEVTDFFEKYRAAGGKAGGGCYCGTAQGPVTRGDAALGALAFAAGLAATGWRRRRGGR